MPVSAPRPAAVPPRLSRWFGRGRAGGETRRVATNTGVQVIGHAVGIAAAFATSVVLTRYLGPGGYGEYIFALTYLGFFIPLVRMGLDPTIVRELVAGSDGEADILAAGVGLKLAIAVGAALAAAVVAQLLDQPDLVRAAILLGSPAILVTALAGRGLIFQARLQMGFRVASEVANHVLYLLLVVIVVRAGGSLVAVFAAYSLAAGASAAVLVAISRRFVPFALAVDRARWARYLRAAAPLGIAELLHQLYFRIDILILAELRDATSVGIYSIASGMTDQAITLFSFLAGSLFPLMVRRHSVGGGGVGRFVAGSLVVTLAVAGVMIATIDVLGEPVIHLVYGPSFGASAEALRVLGLALPFKFVWYVLSFALITIGRQRSLVPVTAVALVFNVAANVLLVPEYGYMGSAWATVATEAIVMAFLGWRLWRGLRE